MTRESTEQIITHRLPLEETHITSGAVLEERDGWRIPAGYGDQLTEYSSVREDGTGLIDLSMRARIRVNGSEAVPFLNGLITNDVKTLEIDRWMPAAFPNVQGRLIASIRVIHDQDGFLIDTEAATHKTVLQTLSRFSLAGNFHVTDLTQQTVLLSVQGKRASDIVCSLVGNDVAHVPKMGITRKQWQDRELLIGRASHTGEDGFDIIIASENAPLLWEELKRCGGRPVGHSALEILRIEAGQPRFGVDMDETNIVTEAGLDEAVSYTKGCYIGQEIIARIHWRGHVAKKLVGISFAATGVQQGAKILSTDGKEIGRLTSVTHSPLLGHSIALGYVRYAYLSRGTAVMVASEADEISGAVTELPFVRGSWYSNSQDV